jgi:fluoroquinolone transport system permease protein
MVVIYFLKDLGNIDKFITLLLFNEPTMVGFVFIGFAIILEKDQEVLSALFITPINHHFYLISRILTLSLISLICAFGMILMAKWTSFNPIHFSIGAFFSCVLFSFVGIYIVSFTTEILHFILRSIPLIVLMSLPFLNYFGFTDLTILRFFPVQGSLYLIDNSYSNSPIISELIFGYISIAVWTLILYWFVYRTFKTKMVNT